MGIPYAEVIGDPIGHSKSPLIHKFWLEALGLEGDYRALRVGVDALGDYLSARADDADWRGCNVTIPHKTGISALLDRVEDDGVGAVNCVVRQSGTMAGFNSDSGAVSTCVGAVRDGDSICMIGAGGAAAAAIAGIMSLGNKRVDLVVRDPDRGRALLDRFGAEGAIFGFDQAAAALKGAAGLINASPLGMDGFPVMPEPVLKGLPLLALGGFVFDMVYAPLETDLMRAARRSRLRRIDGLMMLVEQAAASFRRFFAAPAPREHDPELLELLTT